MIRKWICCLGYCGVMTVSMLLSGCFDLHQSMVIASPESANLRVSFLVDSDLLAAIGEAVGHDESDCENDAYPEEYLPEGLSYRNELKIEEGRFNCEYELWGPLQEFSQLSTAVAHQDNKVDAVRVEILGNNQARITSVYDFTDDMAYTDADGALAKQVKSMLAATLAGRSIRWEIKAPTIISSNGVISPDGRKVTWELALADIISNGGVYQFEAIVDYKTHQPRFF